jgi:hypothetical protein
MPWRLNNFQCAQRKPRLSEQCDFPKQKSTPAARCEHHHRTARKPEKSPKICGCCNKISALISSPRINIDAQTVFFNEFAVFLEVASRPGCKRCDSAPEDFFPAILICNPHQ